MTNLDVRELVSGGTHGGAFLLTPFALWILWRRAGWDLRRRSSLLIYGLGLMACFGASTLCHLYAALGGTGHWPITIDHIAIYLLIAGTYTPIARHLMPPTQGAAALGWAWAAAAVGVYLNLAGGPLPRWTATTLYLVIGWGGLACYAAMLPHFSHRQLALVPIGGAFYSLGAVCHLSGWPTLWPGIIGPHEVFHILVIAGATAQYLFLLDTVAKPPIPKTLPLPIWLTRAVSPLASRPTIAPGRQP